MDKKPSIIVVIHPSFQCFLCKVFCSTEDPLTEDPVS